MAIQLMDFQSLGGLKDASAPGGAVICFSFFTMVLLVLLPGETRPTWAYPAHYTPALAFSVLSMLWLLTRLPGANRASVQRFPDMWGTAEQQSGDRIGNQRFAASLSAAIGQMSNDSI